MSVEESITRLSTTGDELPDSVLTPLSGLQAEELALFEQAWAGIAPERRRQIVTRLVELEEDNIQLDFGSIFRNRLADPDEHVRAGAIEGLWECEAPSLIAPLISLLEEDDSAIVQAEAARALGRFSMLAEHGKLSPEHTAMVSRALLAAINDEARPTEVRCCALEAAAPLSLPEVKKAIGDSYQGDAALCPSSICAMGRSCDPAWLPILLKELDSTDAEVRREAAAALGELEEEEAVPQLADLVYDDDVSVRLAAVLALGTIGGAEAKEALEQCLGDPDELVGQAAEQALSQVAASEGLQSFDI